MSTKKSLLIIFLVLTCIFQLVSCQPAEPLPGTTNGGTMGSDPTTGTTEPTTDTSDQTPVPTSLPFWMMGLPDTSVFK